jgi:RNA polymerase sigma factor (sigma-70 family)
MTLEDSNSLSVDLLRLLHAGDEAAAKAVFERYAERLTRLARSRLAIKLASRVDPEDIVLSAYRSFFAGARAGRFQVEHGGDLWRLLVEVTLHKLYRQAAHHGAQRRSVAREVRIDDSAISGLEATSAEPTPDEALAAAEELEAVLSRLPNRGRDALEQRLQGYELEEIAQRLGCSERTVRRWLAEARRIMAARGGGDFIPSAARRKASAAKLERPIAGHASIESPLAWSDFLLQEQIGAGATGRVYRARWRSRGREVALKFLRKALLREPAAIERFLREAQIVSRLAHPGIVAVHGAGQTPGGGYFLVMDLVRGHDLEREYRRQSPAPSQAARWVADAAGAIHAAHEAGVIHCDLKPGNLLLDEAGQIRLTDFGLAVRLSEGSDSWRLAGTPAFMAPEQVDLVWGAISPRTDVYGLGAVLYFLLFGRPPLIGLAVADVLSQVVSARPIELPEAASAQIAPALIDAVRRCLAKKPAERFANAAELSGVLIS